jgi:hypothetical protein
MGHDRAIKALLYSDESNYQRLCEPSGVGQRQGTAGPTVQPGHDPKVQAEWDERSRQHAQDAYRWWDALAEDERVARRRDHRPYGLSDNAIAIAEYQET